MPIDDHTLPRPTFAHSNRHRLPPVELRIINLPSRRREERPRATFSDIQPTTDDSRVRGGHVDAHTSNGLPNALVWIKNLGGIELKLVGAVASGDIDPAIDDAAGEEGASGEHPRHDGPPVPVDVILEHEVQRAVHVGDEAAADEERAVAGDGHTAEPPRARAVPARHGGDGVPGEVAEVEHLPLDLPRAAVEGEGEEPGGAEAQRPPLREEARLVGEEVAPAAAHEAAGRVRLDGEAEEAAERGVVGEPRDERRLPGRQLLLLGGPPGARGRRRWRGGTWA